MLTKIIWIRDCLGILLLDILRWEFWLNHPILIPMYQYAALQLLNVVLNLFFITISRNHESEAMVETHRIWNVRMGMRNRYHSHSLICLDYFLERE